MVEDRLSATSSVGGTIRSSTRGCTRGCWSSDRPGVFPAAEICRQPGGTGFFVDDAHVPFFGSCAVCIYQGVVPGYSCWRPRPGASRDQFHRPRRVEGLSVGGTRVFQARCSSQATRRLRQLVDRRAAASTEPAAAGRLHPEARPATWRCCRRTLPRIAAGLWGPTGQRGTPHRRCQVGWQAARMPAFAVFTDEWADAPALASTAVCVEPGLCSRGQMLHHRFTGSRFGLSNG